MGILLYWVVLVFKHIIFYESFVMNCQMGSLLGSKCLEQLANREHKLVQIQILESISLLDNAQSDPSKYSRPYKLQNEDYLCCLIRSIENGIYKILSQPKQQLKPIKD